MSCTSGAVVPATAGTELPFAGEWGGSLPSPIERRSG